MRHTIGKRAIHPIAQSRAPMHDHLKRMRKNPALIRTF